jgi:hypothetical protein
MLNKSTFVGYSSRYRKSANESGKSQSTEAPRLTKSPTKVKLPEITTATEKSSEITTHRKLFKNNSIIQPIEAKSNDYEKALKAHLGIKNLSKESSFSSLSPKVNKKVWATPKSQLKSLDFSQLASFAHEETRIEESIRKNVSNRLKKPSKPGKIDEKDKEIQQVQESLNKINALLNKILQKNMKK